MLDRHTCYRVCWNPEYEIIIAHTGHYCFCYIGASIIKHNYDVYNAMRSVYKIAVQNVMYCFINFGVMI